MKRLSHPARARFFFPPLIGCCLRVEILLKTDSGYPNCFLAFNTPQQRHNVTKRCPTATHRNTLQQRVAVTEGAQLQHTAEHCRHNIFRYSTDVLQSTSGKSDIYYVFIEFILCHVLLEYPLRVCLQEDVLRDYVCLLRVHACVRVRGASCGVLHACAGCAFVCACWFACVCVCVCVCVRVRVCVRVYV